MFSLLFEILGPESRFHFPGWLQRTPKSSAAGVRGSVYRRHSWRRGACCAKRIECCVRARLAPTRVSVLLTSLVWTHLMLLKRAAKWQSEQSDNAEVTSLLNFREPVTSG